MKRILAAVIGVVLVTTPLAAQQQVQATSGVSPEIQVLQRRFQFRLMESVIESVVRQGAGEVASRAQGVMPIGLLFIGMSKARGFPLEGHGVVFDVEIPEIRESAIVLNQFRPPHGAAGTPVSNSATVNATKTGVGVVADDPMARSPVTGDPFLADPNQFYRDTVKHKLVDAMLDYSKPLEIGAGEWLTVVARGEEDPLQNKLYLYNDSKVLILRIKGSDLASFYSGKITKDEARKLVIESQF